MRKGKITKVIGVTFSVLVLILIAFQNTSLVYAQEDNEYLNIPQNFEIFENVEIAETQENVTSINLDLESERWNVTGIELNFTDIKLEREVKTVEDSHEGIKYLIKNKDLAFGVQLNITEHTILYGSYIYGYIGIADLISDVYVQINGYEDGKPTNDVYGEPVKLNMTSDYDWYYQNFSKPITLEEGQYYMVINATEYKSEDNSRIYWYYSEYFANNPNLNSSTYDSGVWTHVQGQPFDYKLHQKINKKYYPEDINMTTTIDGIPREISNGENIGTGNLTLGNLNFSVNNDILHIPINNNHSVKLNYTIEYRLNLTSVLISEGNVQIFNEGNNFWTITPEIHRISGNYSFKFKYPQDWFDKKVRRCIGCCCEDITPIDDGQYITIQNEDIIEGAEWTISAYSAKEEITAELPKLEFDVGEEFVISLEDPVLEGSYTLILLDTSGIKKFQDTIYIPGDLEYFTYELPSNSSRGEWTALIYWENGTDAGFQSFEFTVSGSSPIPQNSDSSTSKSDDKEGVYIEPITLLMISIIGLIIAATGSLSYTQVKKYRKNQELKKQKLVRKYRDLLNLNCIMVLSKTSGLNVYEEFYSGKKINPTLISGFLQAIRHFGIELTDADELSQTVKLEYQNSKIIMSDYKNFRLLLIMRENPSHDFLESVKSLSYEIENKFGDLIKKFKGVRDKFIDIQDIIRENLEVSLILPLKVVLPQNEEIEITQDEKYMVNRALIMKKKQKLDIFYAKDLISNNMDYKTIKTTLSLIEKKIFQIQD